MFSRNPDHSVNPVKAGVSVKRWVLPACVLGYLWFTLVNHLRIEWTLNPQYAYGWAVPFLCLYLLLLHREQSTVPVPSTLSSQLSTFLLASLSFAWLPTRLIQEANPEWRLVSWALALEVVGISLILLRGVLEISNLKLQISSCLFPLCFFLVAIPWPTAVEQSLIQGLTRANAAAAVEVLNLLRVTAIQQGNLIEVATGTVGIDEACSGIRSFQGALMVALFLGQFYSLSLLPRLLCVAAGFLFSFLFNLCRTIVLTAVAAKKGMTALEAWHDPAGTLILVGCFLAVWAVAAGMRRRVDSGWLGVDRKADETSDTLQVADDPFSVAEPLRKEDRLQTERPGTIGTVHVPESPLRTPQSPIPQPSAVSQLSALNYHLPAVLFGWLLVAEASTEAWYRWHEARLPAPVTWTVDMPRENPTFRELPISPKTKQLLRTDEGMSARWQGDNQTIWQVIFLRWNPGRTAVNLAKNHTPEVCLTASGREIVSSSELRMFAVEGLQLPFRVYRVIDQGGPIHVFYCLWEDRAVGRSFDTASLTVSSRLSPALAGRRESGQRSLEVALWGVQDQEEAEALFQQELARLVKTGKTVVNERGE